MKFLNPGKVRAMSRKIERVFRKGRRTADEIASDEEIRRKAEAGFPPRNGAAACRGS